MFITITVAVVAFVGGAIFSYLFLRANPNKKAQVDTLVKKV